MSQDLEILGPEPAPFLDRFARLAAQIAEVPFAGVSLVDSQKIWLKSVVGLPLGALDRCDAPCSRVVDSQEALFYQDLQDVPEAVDMVVVAGPPFFRFYAGLPVSTQDGTTLGCLFIADSKPREMNEAQKSALFDLASLVSDELHLNRPNRDLAATLNEETNAKIGKDFFDWLVDHLKQSLHVDHVFISRVLGRDYRRLRTIAVSSEGGLPNSFEYDVENTPCGEILNTSTCVIPKNAASEYPEDKMLEELGIESYVGVSLDDSVGRRLGIFSVMHSGRLPNLSMVERALISFRARVSAELEHWNTIEVLELVIDAASQPTSEGSFQSLAQSMSRVLQVRYGVISQWLGENRCRTLAIVNNGEPEDNFTYEIDSLPARRIYEEGAVFYEANLYKLYPKAKKYQEVKAEAYLGMLIKDSNDNVIGHLSVVHDGPLPQKVYSESLLRIFVARAAAELERKLAYDENMAMERRLMEGQKLESLGVLAGGIAHDFNNLLVGIMGNVSLALVEMDTGGSVRFFLEEIEKASQRAADLARQMLAYSGRGRFLLVPLNLNELIEEMMNLLQVSLPKGVELQKDLRTDLPQIIADSTQIRQVVLNLVLNSAEAIGNRSGFISLRSGLTNLNAAQLRMAAVNSEIEPGDYVYLEVTDTGCGMDAETLARIFDPFFTTKFTGRGLGLAAVQGIIRGHRGALFVTSEVGQGSRFRFLMPLASEQDTQRSVAEPHVMEDWRGEGTVLIVDDEDSVRTVSARMTEQLGFDVLLAENGRDAIEKISQFEREIALVLLDMTMPQLNGEETHAELRKRGLQAPVILMSGYNLREAGRQFEGKGWAGFLQKPFRFGDLRKAYQSALQS